MSERTGIEWTDATWNPWRGCRKVSAGCAHCYMYREQARYGRDPKVVVRSKTTFKDPLIWEAAARERLFEPGRLNRRLLVFTCSWSDFFIAEADPWREEAWRIIHDTPHLTYQVLTKRPERIASHLPADWGLRGYPNVWLGVSGEDYETALNRGAALRRIPARVHFLSAEPWLETADTTTYWGPDIAKATVAWFDWVILGGESGPAARPMNLESARLVRDACLTMRVPFFLKQLGGHPDPRAHDDAVLDGRRWVEIPAGGRT